MDRAVVQARLGVFETTLRLSTARESYKSLCGCHHQGSALLDEKVRFALIGSTISIANGRSCYLLLQRHHRAPHPLLIYSRSSMCESPYTLQWNVSSNHCPTLVDATNSSVPVKIRWSKGYIRSWPSLAHLWSMWYREYYESSMPRLIIRYEDLLFHTEKVIDSIRDCVGATWKSDTFQWQAAPAKTHPYFARFKAPSSLVSAVIKYGSAKGREGTMNIDDQTYARTFIDKAMVRNFHYQDF
jgi:hypothetical protein